MTLMLCRNRVGDFERWKAVFDSHREAHLEAGLVLQRLWRDAEDPNQVFFLFEIRDMEKARAFISAPESEGAGRKAGVVDGEIWFVERADGGALEEGRP